MEPFSKTVFIEYSSAREGQHLITVVQKVDHNRVIIGRIYRDFDPQTKKANYRACDFQGNQMFSNDHDLYTLKNKFKEHGKTIAENAVTIKNVSMKQHRTIQAGPVRMRMNEITKVRGETEEKPKTLDKETDKKSEKQNLNRQEREQDERTQTQFKDLGEVIEKDSENHPNPDHENETTQDEFLEENDSEREMELDEIRGNNSDREYEQDYDIDL